MTTPVAWQPNAHTFASVPALDLPDDLLPLVRMRGKLHCRVERGKELFETGVMGKQSPLVELRVGKASVRTTADKGSGDKGDSHSGFSCPGCAHRHELQRPGTRRWRSTFWATSMCCTST